MTAPSISEEARARVAELVRESQAPRTDSPSQVEFKDRWVTRREADGKVRWRKDLRDRLRDDDPLRTRIAGDHLFIERKPGVICLDDRTGDVLWQTEPSADVLLATDSLLLTSEWIGGVDGRWQVTARNVQDGSASWRLPPEPKHHHLRACQAGSLFFLSHSREITKGFTTCVDAGGHVRFRLDEYVFSAAPLGDDLLLVTSRRVARIKEDGTVVWESTHEEWDSDWPFDTGECMSIPGGDVLVCFYGPISNSGMEVWRVAASTGKVRWKTVCDYLPDVEHSGYENEVRLIVFEKEVIAVSRASAGTIIEVLRLSDGRQLGRRVVRKEW